MCCTNKNNEIEKRSLITSIFEPVDTGVRNQGINPFQNGFTTGAVSTPVNNTNITITGRIIDINGFPSVGTNVSVIGTTQGSSTDNNGNFTIRNVFPGATIRVSRIGAETETFRADSIPRTITLFDSETSLPPIVITAPNNPISVDPATIGSAIIAGIPVKQPPVVSEPRTSKAPMILGLVLGGGLLYSLFSGDSKPEPKPVEL